MSANKKPKLLVSLLLGMTVRNVVLSGILDALKSQFELRILIYPDNALLAQQLEKLGFQVSELTLAKPTLWNKIFSRAVFLLDGLQYYRFFQVYKTDTMEKYISRDKETQTWFWVKYVAARCVGLLSRKSGFRFGLYPTLLSPDTQNLVKQTDHLLMFSTDIVYDRALLVLAQKFQKKAHVMVHSWDNLPGRGFISAKPTRLFVWNQFMVDQAEKLHQISPDRVTIAGCPQHQFYQTVSKTVSREAFLDAYQIPNSNRKIVTYTCNAERCFPDEPDFVSALVKWTAQHEFTLILRVHPKERREYYLSRYQSHSGVILDVPKTLFQASFEGTDLTEGESVKRFVMLMKYSDVVINLGSTISLDAAIFDTPVVCPAFNMTYPKKKWNSAENWYCSSHYKTILSIGGVKLCYTFPELCHAVLDYIKDPSIDREKRQALAMQQTHYLENAGQRIVEAIS